MVENLVFERLNRIMQESIGAKYGGGPFGGIQVVVTGDVSYCCHLSPTSLTRPVLSTVAREAFPVLYRLWMGASERQAIWNQGASVRKQTLQQRCFL
jgi:hypothetical protein